METRLKYFIFFETRLSVIYCARRVMKFKDAMRNSQLGSNIVKSLRFVNSNLFSLRQALRKVFDAVTLRLQKIRCLL